MQIYINVSQKYPAWQELTQLKVTQYIPSYEHAGVSEQFHL